MSRGQFLQLVDHHAAVGQPQGQTGADLFVEDEDFQLAPQLAVVALLGLFEHLQVLVEFLLVAPGRAVDALEHGVLLVAAPVRARHRHQLEGVGGDLPRVLHVRPAAEVLERVVLVGADDRLLLHLVAVLVDAAAAPTRRSVPACRAGRRRARASRRR
jgi:hypothetical protein